MNSFSSQSLKHQQGFTLLELVLVMLIIGLVASTPLVFIDNQDNQFRYEETLKKLELIERAVYLPQTYRGEPVLSGFVVDNGVLPPASSTASSDAEELQPLIGKADNWYKDGTDEWAEYKAYDPYIVIDTLGTPFKIDDHPQLKGYRGNYLNDGLDSAQEFKDGWGVEFTVSNSGANYTATYKGDNAVHPFSYNTAASVAVGSDDWSVPLNQLDIHLTVSSGASRSVALLVFQNDHSASAASDSSLWTTYHFSVSASSAGKSLPDNWSENGNSLSAASAAVINIPAGKHPVFVVVDTDPNVNQSDILEYDRLLVIPGATQPSLQFEVD